MLTQSAQGILDAAERATLWLTNAIEQRSIMT